MEKRYFKILVAIILLAAIAAAYIPSFFRAKENLVPALHSSLPPPTFVSGGAVEARFWESLDNNRVKCTLCTHYCIIAPRRRGICRVRENRDGRLYSLVYGQLASTTIAPIEKDGMKHALPGTRVLALATAGCNFRCMQCHNWHITQRRPEEVRARRLSASQVVDYALQQGARTITGSINEPTIFYEFLYDVAVLARQQGLRMQFHTNGAIAEMPLRALLNRIDQAVVDLKGFCNQAYQTYFGGNLYTVLQSLQIIKEEGAWLEITNLIIPTVNDCLRQIRAMSEWIAENLGPNVPLAFTRFHPSYRLTHLPATPIRTLEAAHRIAREAGLNFVTIGNVPGHRYNSTFCPHTGKRLIHRVHFNVVYNRIENGRSPFSGRPVPGIWE